MKKTLLTLAITAASMAAPAYADYLDFTVDEGSVPGAQANTFVGDYFNGKYNEVYTISAGGPTGLTFATSAYADFTQIFANEGIDLLDTQIGSNLTTSNYRIYAKFTASGTVTNVGGGAQFNGDTGSFSMYIDSGSDTLKSLGATGSSAITFTNTNDDYLIASSSSLVSLANVFGNPGAFDLWFDEFVLSSGDQNANIAGDQNGEKYFPKPRPFHLVTNVDGDFNNISFADIGTEIATTGAFTRTVGGDVSAVFQAVPEPSTIALLGLGLTGLGLSLRRRKSA